jgi:hypothetical protein
MTITPRAWLYAFYAIKGLLVAMQKSIFKHLYALYIDHSNKDICPAQRSTGVLPHDAQIRIQTQQPCISYEIH